MAAKVPVSSKEFLDQKTLFLSAVGEKGSGYNRYSAAMYFHKEGIISLELLEIYRRCCKLDNEDPTKLAIHEGIMVVRESDLMALEMVNS